MGKKGGKQPSYTPPPAPKLPTAEELFAGGTNWAKTNAPIAYGAREGALMDINDPNYYAKFQPTSFEQALTNQYFSNVWPDQEKAIRNQLSLSGMADSPVAADVLGRALGRTQYDIGSYLSNLGNERAINSLNYRNIDPMSLVSPFVNAGMNQSQSQAGFDWNAASAKADADYANAMQSYKNKQANRGMLGSLLGGGVGFLAGGPGGAMIGSQIGSGVMGGNMDLGSALIGSKGMNFKSPMSGLFSSSVNPSAARSASAFNTLGSGIGGINNISPLDLASLGIF